MIATPPSPAHLGDERPAHATERWRWGWTDLAVGAVIVAAALWELSISSGNFFSFDEWIVGKDAQSFTDVVEPYNGHLSVIYLAIYQAMFRLLGLGSYLPYRILGIVSLTVVYAAFYLTTRRRLTPPLAALATVLLVLFEGTSFEPGSFNHPMALMGGIGCAYALHERGRRADLLLAGSLTFALLSAGGGVAIAAACVTWCLCARPPVGRWLAVLLPAGAWAIWYLLVGADAPTVEDYHDSSINDLATVWWRGVRSAFEALALGNDLVGAVLGIGFVVLLGLRLRAGGLRGASTQLAWTVGLTVWWIGLAQSRSVLADSETFRYQFFGTVLVLLAIVPEQPYAWARRVARAPALARWGGLGAAVGVVVIAGLIAASTADTIESIAARQEFYGQVTKQQVLVANLGPDVVPDDAEFTLVIGLLTVGQYREVASRFGAAMPTTPETADADMARLWSPITDVRPGGRPDECAPLSEPVDLGPETILNVQSGPDPVDIGLRRFGDELIHVTTLPPQHTATLWLSSLLSEVPWVLEADGACLTPLTSFVEEDDQPQG